MVDTPQHRTAANTPHDRSSSAPAGPEHDRRQQHHGADGHNDDLQAKAEGEPGGRLLVGFVANGGAGAGTHFGKDLIPCRALAREPDGGPGKGSRRGG